MLAMCQKWFEDTGVEFDWQSIPNEGAQEKINLMLASGEDLPDAFWNFGDGKSGNIVVQYADQDIFLPTEGLGTSSASPLPFRSPPSRNAFRQSTHSSTVVGTSMPTLSSQVLLISSRT